jgi:hypothetical protein
VLCGIFLSSTPRRVNVAKIITTNSTSDRVVKGEAGGEEARPQISSLKAGYFGYINCDILVLYIMQSVQ